MTRERTALVLTLIALCLAMWSHPAIALPIRTPTDDFLVGQQMEAHIVKAAENGLVPLLAACDVPDRPFLRAEAERLIETHPVNISCAENFCSSKKPFDSCKDSPQERTCLVQQLEALYGQCSSSSPVIICKDGSACLAVETCCPLDDTERAYGCCPYSQGVCCAAGGTCCPSGYTCSPDGTKCDN